MARRLLTGVLLVGGRSTRFGSPKALARLGGETLAERGWRVLGEACDEVIAVGKTADELPLPFPVVDDATPERAPVYGVIAGLRAASHDVAVFLPVDCAVVTATLLRELGDAIAVPQTGPLPGAYGKDMRADLETRIQRGELSLRGVNPAVLQVDAWLLRDVDVPADLATMS